MTKDRRGATYISATDMKTPFPPFSHLLLIILICISTTPSQAQGGTSSQLNDNDRKAIEKQKELLSSLGDSSTMLRKRREAASFQRSETLRQHLTGQATGLTSQLGGLDGLSCAERAVKRARLLRNIQLAKEEVVRRALTGSYPCECFTQPDIVELIRKTRLYGTVPGKNMFTEQMKNLTPDEIYQAARWAEGLAGNWEYDIDHYAAKLRQKAKTDSASAAELAEYEELTLKRRDNELGINISILKKISMTPGDKLRSINRRYVKKKQAPLYQKAYYMAFDGKYRRGAAGTSFPGDCLSDRMMRAAMGHPHEMDSSWSPSTIIGSLIHFFSLLP